MRSGTFTGAAALLLFGCATVAHAQTARAPGQLASASETSSMLQPFPASSVSTSIVSTRPDFNTAQQRHEAKIERIWITSIFALAAGSGMDAASSWGKYERNSLLASSDGKFGAKGLSFKFGLAGAAIVPQLLLRNHTNLRARFAILNFAEAGIFTGISIHNIGIPAPRN